MSWTIAFLIAAGVAFGIGTWLSKSLLALGLLLATIAFLIPMLGG